MGAGVKTGLTVVVMKFGGTSVATREGRSSIAARITESRERNESPVVVVSAMGRLGDPYATDTLLALVNELPSEPREVDMISSVGEVISAVVVAHELRAAGIDACALTGSEAGILTDGEFESATITEIHTGALAHLLNTGCVPVVCGFQGVGPDGAVHTLGRGGSDTTACALGVALDAREVVIFTDVDGVMSADPRTCDSASVLETVSADELFQMARSGSRVVHTPAAELALSSGLLVKVRNTYSQHPGTSVAHMARYQPASVATAVTHTEGVTRVRVALPAPEGTAEHMAAQARVYRAMASAGVSLDMFTPIGERLVFTIRSSAMDDACAVLGELGLTYRITADLAKVTLVGAGMHGVPGVVASVAELLAEAGVNVLQTADSHTTISVLVPQPDARTAIDALHRGFDLGGVAQ